MSLVSLRQLLDHAAEHDYGMPAFNVNNMEQVQAIMQAADETDSPAILVHASRAARDICKARFEAFGSAGQASKLRWSMPVQFS